METPLPRTWYTDPEQYRIEMAKVFECAWLPVAHVSNLPSPGAYLTTRVGSQEIVLVRGHDAVVRAFYNVCQHRAHRLLDGAGCLRTAITCPYHAWAYEFDGALRFARHSGEVEGFDESRFGLTPIATDQFAGFVVVCLDEAPGKVPAGLRDLETRLLADHPQLASMREVRRRESVLQANWKTIIENYLECYHCNVAHPSFGNFDVTTWKHLLGDGWSRQGRVADGGEDKRVEHSDISGLSAWWQWPNIFWARAHSEDSFAAVFHEPLAADRTRQIRIVYSVSGHEDDELRVFNELFDKVFQEDVSLVENVQRGLASRGYRGGALIEHAPASAGWSEHAVRYFQDRVRRAVC